MVSPTWDACIRDIFPILRKSLKFIKEDSLKIKIEIDWNKIMGRKHYLIH